MCCTSALFVFREVDLINLQLISGSLNVSDFILYVLEWKHQRKLRPSMSVHRRNPTVIFHTIIKSMALSCENSLLF